MNPYGALIKWGLIIFAALGAIGWFSHVRYNAGQKDVQNRWDAAVVQERLAAQTLADKQAKDLRDISQKLQDALNDQNSHKPTVTVIHGSVCQSASPANGSTGSSAVRSVAIGSDASGEVPGLGEALKDDADNYASCQPRLDALIDACIAAGCNKSTH